MCIRDSLPAVQASGPAQEIRRVPTLTLEVPKQPASLEYSSDPKKRINPKIAPLMRY